MMSNCHDKVKKKKKDFLCFRLTLSLVTCLQCDPTGGPIGEPYAVKNPDHMER